MPLANITQLEPFNLDSSASYTFANVTATSNVVAGNVNVSGIVSATGNIYANVLIGNGSQLTGVVASTASTANTVTDAAQPNITSVGILTSVSVSGNATSGNLLTGGLISAAGNIRGDYIIGNGSQLTGIVSSYGNANVAAYLPTYSGNLNPGNLLTNGYISAQGNIIGGDLITSGMVTATGNVTGNYFIGNGSQLTGLPSGYSNAQVATYLASGTDTSNIITSANVSGGNVLTSGTVSATGNITGNYFLGNGSQLTGVTATTANTAVTVTGNAQPNITSVGTLTSVSVSGNATSGNLLTAGQVSATGNVSGNYFLGNGSQLTGVTATAANTANTAITVTGNAQPNITSVGILTSVSVGGNVDAGNVSGTLYPSGGNGVAGIIFPPNPGGGTGDNATIKYYASSGQDTVLELTVTNNATDIIKLNASGGTEVTGTLTGGNLVATGIISAGGNIAGGNLSVTNIAGTLTTASQNNITSVGTLSSLSVTANATSGNLLTGGLVSAAGNVTANYFIGNGSQLTGLPASYANANVAAYLASGTDTSNIITSANVSGGNIVTAGLVSATGNVTGAYFIGNGSQLTGVTATDVAASALTGNTLSSNVIYSSLTSVGTLTSLSVSGNTTTGNLITPGLISSAGNVTSSGSIYAAGMVSAAGNVITNSELYVGNGAQGTGLTNPVIVARATGTAYVQVAAQNTANTGSADLIAYGDNGSDADGWTDMGMAGSGFNDTAYTITYANDGYLFVQGNAAGAGGNLVIATGGYGGKDIVFATGGFLTANEKMRFINATGQFYIETTTAANSTSTGALRVGGGAGIAGNVYVGGLVSALGNIVTAANVTGGNLLTSGLVSAAGNIIGNYIIGNGSQLTGLPSSYSNADVATYLASGTDSSNIITSANVSGGNLLTGGLVSATGNITGANVNTGAVRNSSGTLTIGTGSGNINLTPAGNIVVGGTYINGVTNPVQDQDVATKNYVDTAVSTGISYHQPVLAATTTTLATATGGSITYTQPNGAGNGIGATLTTTGSFNLIDTANVQTIGTRILVKNEANGVYNGVYTWSNATAIVRSTDTDEYGPVSAEQLSLNDYFFVQSGNVNAGSSYIVDSPTGTITFGTSNIQFAQFSQSQIYTANGSAGLSLTGTVFSAKVDNNTTAFDGSGNIIVKASANLTTPNIGAATGTSLSTTGNLSGGNVNTGGLITATGNIGSAANISATYFIGNGAFLTGISSGGSNYSNANVAAYLPTYTGNISANNVSITTSLTGNIASLSGNITGGNVLTGGLVSATSNITSAANISGGNLLSSALIQGVTVSASGNVVGGNLTTAGLISATSTITSAANITGGNLLTGGLLSSTGNVVSAANVIAGNIVTSGSGGNITGANVITANTFSASANITGGNILTGGLISSTGNITSAGNVSATYFIGNGSQLTGLPATYANANVAAYLASGTDTSNIITTANVSAGNVLTSGLISATSTITSAANITGGNVLTGGLISATSSITSAANITGGNLVTAGLITATGNITAVANIAGGNVLTSGLISATSTITSAANITGGNLVTAGLITATGNISSAGNISATYFIGNGSLLTGISGGGSSTSISNGNSNVVVAANSNVSVSIGGTANVAVFATTGEYVTGLISATGGVIANSITTTGTGGNIQGANVISANVLSANTITTTGSTGNITGANVISAVTISASGNVIGANVVTGTGTGGNITGANVISANTVTATANITGGNILTGGLISATGNITSAANIAGGNLLITGLISATGNITGGNILGGANVNATTHTGTTVSVSANITGGNILTGGIVSAAGNIFAATLGANINFANNTASFSSFKGYSLIVNARGSVSGSQTIDLSLGNYVTLTITGTTTLSFTNPVASPNASGFIMVITDGGSATVIWPGNAKWPNGIAPTLTTSGVDVLVFITNDGGTTWRGMISMTNSS